MSRLENLTNRHQDLKGQIEKGYKNYMKDEDLKQLKKEKLLRKDQITRIKNADS